MSNYTDSDIQDLIAENTRLKREVEMLRSSHQRVAATDADLFKQALSMVGDAICIINTDGDIIYVNQAFCDEYGIESDYKGKFYDLDVTTPTREAFDARVNQIRQNRGQLVYQTKILNKEDHKKHYHQASAFMMDYGTTEIIAIFTQDITQLVQSRDELRELNVLFDTILDSLPVYLFVKDVDNDLRYVYWNKAFADYSKIPASKVIGNTDFEVFPSYQDAKKFRDDDLTLLSTGGRLDTHETYEAADGKSRIVQTIKTLCHREGRGPLLIGTSMDLTSLENIEQELIQERLRAEQSDRLKSTFLANMSHEIRTPLNAIVGFSNLLTQPDIDDEQRKQFAEIINQNSDGLLQLINDILDISKIEAGTLEYVREPMDIADVFDNIYAIQHRLMHEGVKLVLDIDPQYPHITINEDRNRLAQVVNNLINNAVKFTRQGEIRFGYRVSDEWIRVFVKDTGIGIAQDKLDKVFDRFVKLNTFAQGTGLGLAICKLIVGLFGGDISVASVEGEGSTFTFTIPYKLDKSKNVPVGDTNKPESNVEQQAVANKPKEEVTEADAANKKTILIAEDILSNFLLLKTLLGKTYNLLWAKDGAQAVEMFKDNNPDIILMDVKMPVMDGLAATKLIRSHSRTVPIIALTAYAFESDRQKAEAAGVNDYLTKPIAFNALRSVLSKYL